MTRILMASPEGGVARQPQALAPLPASLQGARLAVLENGKPNARLLLTTLATEVARLTGMELAAVEGKPNAAAAAEADLLHKLRLTADVVLTGSGD